MKNHSSRSQFDAVDELARALDNVGSPRPEPPPSQAKVVRPPPIIQPRPVERHTERIVYVHAPPERRGFFDGAANVLAGLILIGLFLLVGCCVLSMLLAN